MCKETYRYFRESALQISLKHRLGVLHSVSSFYHLSQTSRAILSLASKQGLSIKSFILYTCGQGFDGRYTSHKGFTTINGFLTKAHMVKALNISKREGIGKGPGFVLIKTIYYIVTEVLSC